MKTIKQGSITTHGVLMILILFFASLNNLKATAVWTNGGLNNIWSDASNWTGGTGIGGIPGASDAVLIPNTAAGDPILEAGDVAASLTIESAHTVTVDASGYGLTVGGNIGGAGTLDLSNYTSSASITVGGNITVGSLILGTTTVNVAGNFTPGSLTAGSTSTVTLNGSSLQNIGANTFHSLVDNNSGTGSNVATLTGNVTVTGNISGTGTLAAGSNNLTVTGNITGITYNAGSGTTTLTGNLGISTLIPGTSTFILNGTGRQLQNAFTFYNLEIDNTGTSETFFDDQTVNGTLSGSGTLDGGSITVTAKGDITINAITPNATKYFLSGTTANQNITKGYTFYELHVNNSAGTNPGATLTGGNVTVSHLLSLDAGVLTLGSNNLIVSTPVTGLTGTPSVASYIQTNGSGTLKWSAATSGTVFPVGDASYNPITIQPQSAADFYSVRAVDGVTEAGNAPVTDDAVNVMWFVSPTNTGSQTVLVTPQWTSSNPDQELGVFNHSASNIDVAYRTSLSDPWTLTKPGTPTNSSPIFSLQSGETTPGVSDITMVNGGTTYIIGVGGPTSPLPVNLVSFNANYRDGIVNLDWQTASEINNSHFDIERSIDGTQWMVIGSVEGHGNSQVINNYAAIDNLAGVIPSGTIYYRLKQVDFNGAFEYSMVKAVAFTNSTSTAMQTYPNPANNILNVAWVSNSGGNAVLKIMNLSGSTIYTENISGAGSLNKKVDFSSFVPGTYIVQIISDNNVSSKMVYKN